MRIEDMTLEEYEKLSPLEKFRALPEIMKMDMIGYMLFECRDDLYKEFFDMDSKQMLDEKYEVLSQLNKGVPSGEIENYYKTMENYPKDGSIWDI